MSAILPINPDPRFRLSTATGGQTTFSVPFPFQDNADIAVIKIDAATGEEETLTETTHYGLTGAGEENGGTVTLVTPAAAGDQYIRVGRAVLARVQSIVRSGKFRSRAIDDDIDRFIIIAQELSRDAGRSWKAPFGANGGYIRPGLEHQLAAFDANGDLTPANPQSLAFKGPWDVDATYLLNDIVEYGGSLWIARREHDGSIPGDAPDDWNIFLPGGSVGDGTITPSKLSAALLITVNTELNIPSDYASLSVAWSALKAARITRDAVVKIKFANGSYEYDNFLLNHPDGERIQLIGNVADPTMCVIEKGGDVGGDLFVVSLGHELGLIDGFTLTTSVRQQLGATVGTGVLATHGAGVTLGANLIIEKFAYSVAARFGSWWRGTPGLTLRQAADVAGWAFVNSTFECDGVIIDDVEDTLTGLGFGLQAEYGSVGASTGFDIQGCKVAGVAALSTSQLRVFDGSSHDNEGSGAYAGVGSSIEAHGSSFIDNALYGLEYFADGSITGNSMTVTGNTVGNYQAHVRVANGSLGGRIAFSDGPGRIDHDGAEPIYFNTSGGVQFEVRHAANTANHPFVAGAATGNPARVGASGADTNIDLHLQPQGTGKLRWGVHGAGSVTPNGRIEWKLDDGATVRVAAERL